MDWQGWFTLGVIGLVFIGLVRDLAPPDVLLLGGALTVTIAGIITPEQMLEGAANEGVLTVAALFVVAAGLRETGALDSVADRVFKNATTERQGVLRLAPPVIGMSAVLNNTPVVAMLMPIVAEWCRKNRISPSRLLMPLSYLAILGGTCTLIGTSTNLVIDGMMRVEAAKVDAHSEKMIEGLAPMGLFELGYVGLPYAAVGVAYLLLIGRRLLPDRKDLLEQLGASPREYLVDMVIQPGCRLNGQQVEAAGLRRLPGLFLIEITRRGRVIAPVGPDEVLREGDRLTFSGVVSTIVDLERIPGLVPAADESYETREAERRHRRLTEAVISNTSPIAGQTIRGANFRAMYNAAIIAVHRGGTRLKGRIGDIVLRPGDTLLLQTGAHFQEAHRNNPDFFLVSSINEARPVRHERSTIALLLLVVLVALMATGVLPIVLAAFLAAGLMVGFRCISSNAARQSIDWQTLITIASAFGLAAALQASGAASFIAHLLFDVTGDFGPRVTLLAVYLIALLFTEMITNNAAAALVFPFVIALADEAGWNPRPFLMAVAFAASASFATPIGYQTNMMVYGPGGYRFTDFLRVGAPLSVLLAIVAVILIPIFWPF